jgi:hypothetical protein
MCAWYVTSIDGWSGEVVVISQENFNQTKPSLKSYLIGSGYADEQDDAFDVAMRSVRVDSSPLLQPRNIELKDLSGVHPGHGCRK